MRLALKSEGSASHVCGSWVGFIANVDGAEVLLEAFTPEKMCLLEVFVG